MSCTLPCSHKAQQSDLSVMLQEGNQDVSMVSSWQPKHGRRKAAPRLFSPYRVMCGVP